MSEFKRKIIVETISTAESLKIMDFHKYLRNSACLGLQKLSPLISLLNSDFVTSKASTKTTFLDYLRISTTHQFFQKIDLATGPLTDFSNRHMLLRAKVAENVPRMCRWGRKRIKLVKTLGKVVLHALKTWDVKENDASKVSLFWWFFDYVSETGGKLVSRPR